MNVSTITKRLITIVAIVLPPLDYSNESVLTTACTY